MSTLKTVRKILDDCRGRREDIGTALYYGIEAAKVEAIKEATEMLEIAEGQIAALKARLAKYESVEE